MRKQSEFRAAMNSLTDNELKIAEAHFRTDGYAQEAHEAQLELANRSYWRRANEAQTVRLEDVFGEQLALIRQTMNEDQ